ncbi:MAG: hemolysin family protein, partial [Anaerolineaceae bacterium]|nr:hemolysin family protein [Anaerolineaceae bacterium]
LALQAFSLLLVVAFAWLARSALLPFQADTLAQVLLVIASCLLLLVVGRLLPQVSGAAWADRLAPALAGTALLLLRLAWPLLAVLSPLNRYLMRVTGAARQAGSVTEQEIMTLVDAGQREGTIEDEEKAMIFSVLQFTDTLVREVMVPRIDIVSISRVTTLQEALGLFVGSGHSRLPVHDGNIDHIEGLLYAKDLLAAWHIDAEDPPSIPALMRPAHFVAGDRRADLVLKELQQSKIHLAIVLDEYGGTAGVVTLEDLVEEIVGDIQDEYDTGEEVEFIRQTDGEYSIDASMDLHDVNELLQVDLPTDSSDTLGGFIYDLLGRVPQPGEVLPVMEHGLTLRIDSLDGLRIRKVQVTRANESLASATGGKGGDT